MFTRKFRTFCVDIFSEVLLTCFQLEVNRSRETPRYNEPHLFPVTDCTENGLLLLCCCCFCVVVVFVLFCCCCCCCCCCFCVCVFVLLLLLFVCVCVCVVFGVFSFSFFFFLLFSFSYDRLIKIIIHCRATNKQ